MAPVTRCEARASHTGFEHGVQLEQILENFEQFRRKHIAQNRDIVRANTLAQLRIRELEARVLALEQERAEQSLEYGKQQAHAQRLQYALDCVRVGWETMAQGLEEAGVDAQTGHTRYQQQQESVQISLQHDLPSTRSHITRFVQPMTQITELDDETGYGMDCETNLDASSAQIEHRLASPLQGDGFPASVTRRRHSRRHSQSIQPTIPCDSLNHESELVDNQSMSSTDPSQQASTSIDDELIYDKEQTPSQISSSCIQPSDHASSLSDTQNLPKALSSEAVDLASAKFFANTPYYQEQETNGPSPDYSNAPTQSMSSSQSITTEAPSAKCSPLAGTESPDAQQIATQNPAAPRKRNRSSRVSIQELNTEPEMPLGSRRARKSVNYALPKLNTKMRKPDHLMEQDKDKLHQTHDLDSDSAVQVHTQGFTPQKVGATEQVDNAEQAEAAEQVEAAKQADTAVQSDTAAQVEAAYQVKVTNQSGAANQVKATERSEAADQANPMKQRSAISSNLRRQSSHQNIMPTPHTLLTSTASMPVRSATPDTKRPMPPSAKLERFRKFSRDPLKERNEQPSAWLLQEQSTQDMPTWASSLLNLASPEPRKSVKSTRRASLESHGNANLANPPAVSSTESRRARRRSQKENHVR